MEDEYKVVCALSNDAAFDDLSRSQYSLKPNISQTVHPIHYIFGSRLRTVFVVGGSSGAISGSLGGGAVARNTCDSWAFLLVLLQH